LTDFDHFWRLKKVDGSWFFWSIFHFMGPILTLYGFIEKQAPQKALCLGPDPPPGEKMKFIDFWRFLPKIGPSIEPEKVEVKSASTANPPQKVKFIGIFNNSRPNLSGNSLRPNLVLFSFLFGPWYCNFTLPFFGIRNCFYSEFFWSYAELV
jgi:hypothetical protein